MLNQSICRLFLTLSIIFATLSACGVDEAALIKQFHYQQGLRLYAEEKYSQALPHFEGFLAYEKDNLEILVLAAVCAREAGIQTYNIAYNLTDNNQDDLAKKHIEEGNNLHQLSYELFRYAIAKFPEEPAPYYEFGIYYYLRATNPVPIPYPLESEDRLNEKESAISLFRKVLTLDDDAFRTYKFLGILLTEKEGINDKREGVKLLGKYLDKRKLDKKSWEEWNPRSQIEERKKQQSLEIVTADIIKVSELLIRESLTLSKEMLKQEMEKELVEILRQIEPHDYTNYKIKTEIAVVLYHEGVKNNLAPLVNDSLLLLEKAYKVNPEYPKMLKYIGLCYKFLGQKLFAREHLEKYIAHLEIFLSKPEQIMSEEEIQQKEEVKKERNKIQKILDSL